MRIEIILLLLLLIASCRPENAEKTLIENLLGKEYIGIDELWDKVNYEEIYLEESDSIVIGEINKIIGNRNNYYVLSNDNRIHVYDNSGKLISILYKQGRGPSEYMRVEDFDVSDDGNAIWIADYNKINIYTQNNNSWNLDKTINFDFVINKFRHIGNDRIILLAGQNDKSLLIADHNGVIHSEYLDKQIPFILFRGNQFIKKNDSFIFQLGLSNSCIEYSENEFKEILLSKEKSFLSKEKLVSMYDDYEYDYLSKLKECDYLNSLCFSSSINAVYYLLRGKKAVGFLINDKWYNILIDNEDLNYLTSFSFCDSNDGLLFYKYQDNEDLNPMLVRIY